MTRVLTTPQLLLRLEGGALFLLGLLLYSRIGGNWLAFVLLLLVPDVAMLGYLAGPRVGAAVYNLGHVSVFPAALGAAGIVADNRAVMALALIWFAHINMDRALAYGFKLQDGFKHTHLNTPTPETAPADRFSGAAAGS